MVREERKQRGNRPAKPEAARDEEDDRAYIKHDKEHIVAVVRLFRFGFAVAHVELVVVVRFNFHGLSFFAGT